PDRSTGLRGSLGECPVTNHPATPGQPSEAVGPLDVVPRHVLGDRIRRLARDIEFDIHRPGRMFRIGLNVLVAHPEPADFGAQVAAEVVVADAADHDRLVAELIAVEGEVERRPAGSRTGRQEIPEDLADCDDGSFQFQASSFKLRTLAVSHTATKRKRAGFGRPNQLETSNLDLETPHLRTRTPLIASSRAIAAFTERSVFTASSFRSDFSSLR